MLKPEIEAARIAKIREANRRPERRKRSGEIAKAIRLWEHGLPHMTPDVFRRCGQTNSERRLAHIPLAHRETYAVLVKKLGAKEAARIILDHAERVAERAHG